MKLVLLFGVKYWSELSGDSEEILGVVIMLPSTR